MCFSQTATFNLVRTFPRFARLSGSVGYVELESGTKEASERHMSSNSRKYLLQ